jgi:hypothetical protein
MKQITKISAVLLICTGLFYTACKKSETKGTPKTDYRALSRQIALSFNAAISKGSTGFKSSANGSKRVNDISTHLNCGATDFTPYDNTTTVNDTTTTEARRTYFTYICNNNVLNEYQLRDTISLTMSGNGFQDVFHTVQSYNVKALNSGYTASSSNGTIFTGGQQKKINGQGATTAYNNYDTGYTLNNVIVTQTADGPVITGGSATFQGSVSYKNSDTPDGYTGSHTGIIYFLPDNIIKVAFYGENASRYYEINTKTGAVAEM